MFWLKMVLFANAAALFFWSYFIQGLTPSEALNGKILRQAQNEKGDAPSQNRCPHRFNQ